MRRSKRGFLVSFVRHPATLLCGLLALAVASPARAQSAELVKDINTRPSRTQSSNPEDLVVIGGALYLSVEMAGARVLYSVDLATGATRRFGTAEDVRDLRAVGSVLYFVGTPRGSTLDYLYRFPTSGATVYTVRAFREIRRLTVVGTTLYLCANDGVTGLELWKSTGTTATLVKDVIGGIGGSDPQSLAAVGSLLYFSADDGVHGRELWWSNGTAAGTALVQDLYRGGSSSNPSSIVGRRDTRVGRVVYFAASHPTLGRELWVTTAVVGPTLVADLAFGRGSSSPSSATLDGSGVWFAAAGSSGRELYYSLGTPATTRVVRDILPGRGGSNPTEFIAYRSRLYFSANDGTAGRELWSSDGTAGGTRMIEVNAGSASASPTSIVPTGVAPLKIYFAAEGLNRGRELWVSDGVSASFVRDIDPGDSNPAHLAPRGTDVLFAATAERWGREVWQSDGTGGGTQLLADINTSADGPDTQDSSPSHGVSSFGSVIFRANDGIHGTEPWISDGTAAGTRMIKEVVPGSASSAPREFRPGGSHVYFVVRGELWRTDGTEVGTTVIFPTPANVRNITPLGDVVFFANIDATHGMELWIYDGAPRLVRDIRPGTASSNPQRFVPFGDRVLFLASDGAHGTEWWISDGTTAGTQLVYDLNVGATSTTVQSSTVSGGRMWFAADDGVNGRELWVTDGSAAGTTLAVDMNPSGSSGLIWPTAVGDALYFIASPDGQWSFLYRSDGTQAGTVPVQQFAGPGFTSLFPLVDQFCFVEARSSSYVLWFSDGTAAGTRSVPFPGLTVHQLRAAGSRHLWFPGYDPSSGLWQSDGTVAGTFALDNPSAYSGVPNILGFANGVLLFEARHPEKGRELFRVRYAPGLEAATSIPIGSGRGVDSRTPTLRVTDLVLGGFATISGFDAPGGRSIIVLLSFQPPSATALGDGFYAYVNLVATELLGPFQFPGDSWSLPLPIPNDPVLLDLDLAWQGYLGSPASPRRYELTNGVFTSIGR